MIIVFCYYYSYLGVFLLIIFYFECFFSKNFGLFLCIEKKVLFDSLCSYSAMLCPYLRKKLHHFLNEGFLFKFGFFSDNFRIWVIFSA